MVESLARAGPRVEGLEDIDTLRSILFSVSHVLDPQARKTSGEQAARIVNAFLRDAEIDSLPIDDRSAPHISELRSQGITTLGELLDSEKIRDIRRYFESKKVFAGHIWSHSDGQEMDLEASRSKRAQASYWLEDVLEAPHLFELANSPLILSVVQEYLGCVPTLYQLNTMWALTNSDPSTAIAQAFHRDQECLRFCVLFVYLTDVDKASGAQQYFKGTHDPDRPEYAEHSRTLDPAHPDVVQVDGAAGTGFIADPYGIHRGIHPEKRDRLLFWARYGIYDNGVVADATPRIPENRSLTNRIPTSEAIRYVNRIFLAPQATETRLLHPIDLRHIRDRRRADETCAETIRVHGKWRFLKAAVRELIPGLSRRNALTPERSTDTCSRDRLS